MTTEIGMDARYLQQENAWLPAKRQEDQPTESRANFTFRGYSVVWPALFPRKEGKIGRC
jgi:hypothetical protein